MKKLTLTLENNNISMFKDISENIYLDDKVVISLLRKIIKLKKLDFFDYFMRKFLTPEVFWETHKQLVKNNEYDFLKLMIKINCDNEPEENKKNSYANELLFNFIEKDDLFFVEHLVEKQQASTENNVECELSVLNECAKYNAIKCFDYFLSKGKNVHDFEDLALFNALENKHYNIVSLIISSDSKIDNQIAQYFFRYAQQSNNEPISNKEFLKLANIAEPALLINSVLQNSLNYQHIKRGYLKLLENNLKKGHSPIGDEYNDLMGLAIMLRNNAMKTAKTLLDYGGIIEDSHKANLAIEEKQELENYPRFSKLKENLEKKLTVKTKEKTRKI